MYTICDQLAVSQGRCTAAQLGQQVAIPIQQQQIKPPITMGVQQSPFIQQAVQQQPVQSIGLQLPQQLPTIQYGAVGGTQQIPGQIPTTQNTSSKPPLINAGAAIQAGAGIANMAAGMLSGPEVQQGTGYGEQIGASNAEKGAGIVGQVSQIGSMFGPIGAGIGSIVNLGASLFGAAKKRKRQKEINRQKSINENADQRLRYEETLDEYKTGGKMKKPSIVTIKLPSKVAKKARSKNLIPRGVLHEERNRMGSKGLPLMYNGSKIAEIERDEIIFHKELTDKVEKLSKEYLRTKDEKVAEELGKLVSQDVIFNTNDMTGKFL